MAKSKGGLLPHVRLCFGIARDSSKNFMFVRQLSRLTSQRLFDVCCRLDFTTRPRIAWRSDEMPKEPVAARELKRQRMEKMSTDKFRGSPPGFVSIDILGNGGPGNPKVLFIATEHNRYLFNCGEATQRLSHEHG